MNFNFYKASAVVIIGLAFSAPTYAAPIACVTGDLAKYGTTIKAPSCDKNSWASICAPDSAVSSTGETLEGVDTIHLLSLADIKQNQSNINQGFFSALSKINTYCVSGMLGNAASCARGKKEFLDALAWAYNTKSPIDCKYLANVSEETQEKIVENPIQFLQKSRFDCGINGEQLCCSSCLETGFESESNW